MPAREVILTLAASKRHIVLEKEFVNRLIFMEELFG
jgi:hypothetical protein